MNPYHIRAALRKTFTEHNIDKNTGNKILDIFNDKILPWAKELKAEVEFELTNFTVERIKEDEDEGLIWESTITLNNLEFKDDISFQENTNLLYVHIDDLTASMGLNEGTEIKYNINKTTPSTITFIFIGLD